VEENEACAVYQNIEIYRSRTFPQPHIIKLVFTFVACWDLKLIKPMASQKCKESILQIIDQLRQRKARPDIVRICHMAARKHGMKWQETESHLEKLVESGTVVKVDYKGNVSYRNTTKWKKTHSWKKIVHSDLVCKNIISAVREIAQNSLDRGASVKEVDRWLSTNTSEPHLERSQIRAALDKEVENGLLKKLANGNYISSESSNPEKKIAEKPSTSVSSPGKRGRPPSKRKVSIGKEMCVYLLLAKNEMHLTSLLCVGLQL
jgi:hypothetical protein